MCIRDRPTAAGTVALAAELTEKYGVPVLAANCMEMDAEAFHAVLQKVLYEFPISSVQLLMPGWIKCMDDQDPWKTELFAAVQQDCHSLSTIDRDVYKRQMRYCGRSQRIRICRIRPCSAILCLSLIHI